MSQPPTPEPLEGFVEVLSGLIRLGPNCTGYRKPYDRVVTFSSTDGKTAVLKGWVGQVTHAHRRKIQALLAPLGLVIDWERGDREPPP